MTHRLLFGPAAALATAAIVASCGGATSYSVTGQGVAIGADAAIEVEPTDAGNRRIALEVRHLPPPDRVVPGASTYAVWIVPMGGTPMPAGRLEYDEGDRRGELQLVTPYEDFRILVTAEPALASPYPSRAVVLEQDVSS